MGDPVSVVDRLAVSPCSNPEMGLEGALHAYAGVGYRKFEVFTSWVRSAFDIDEDPDLYLAEGRQHGMRFVSFHLPVVRAGDEDSFDRSVKAACFAKAVGAGIVLFKADNRSTYVQNASRFLDATESLGLTAVLQKHVGTPLSSLDDVREVHQGISDRRMKALLEVGHFHSAGVSWREACDSLTDRIALVHIKDQVGRQSVPFGRGEIDLPKLFAHLRHRGYAGDYVVEMEVEDSENTLTYLAQAREYIRDHCTEGQLHGRPQAVHRRRGGSVDPPHLSLHRRGRRGTGRHL